MFALPRLDHTRRCNLICPTKGQPFVSASFAKAARGTRSRWPIMVLTIGVARNAKRRLKELSTCSQKSPGRRLESSWPTMATL